MNDAFKTRGMQGSTWGNVGVEEAEEGGKCTKTH